MILRRETGITYDKMVFFDDYNWGDDRSKVTDACPGVVTQKTPDGIQENEFLNCSSLYAMHYGPSYATIDTSTALTEGNGDGPLS